MNWWPVYEQVNTVQLYISKPRPLVDIGRFIIAIRSVLYILRTIYYASLCFLGRKDVRSEKHRNLIWFVSHDDRWKFMAQIWKKDQTSISPKCSQTFQNIAVTQLHKLRHSVSMQTKRHQKDKKTTTSKNVFDNPVIPLCLSKPWMVAVLKCRLC